jgi:carboxypeptidase Taq
VTRVRRSLIRTDADELTYDLHIMLRVELEADLIAGKLKVENIPEAWNAAMQRDLGLTPPGDGDGCLQDIHWSSGMFGSFCTYTVGNVMGAQLFETAMAQDSVAEGIGGGDYAPLHRWLKEHVWQHGRRFTRDEVPSAPQGGRWRWSPISATSPGATQTLKAQTAPCSSALHRHAWQTTHRRRTARGG